MRVPTIIIATAALSGLLAAGSPARAGVSGYTFTTISVPGTSAGNTAVFGINDRGQIVGNFADYTGLHGFLDSHGNFTTIDAPGSTFTELAGINNRDEILGAAVPIGNFIYAHGTFTTLTNDPYYSTGINDLGQIVGSGAGPEGNDGFVDTRGNITLIDVPGAFSTGAIAINDSGQIVGEYGDSTGFHAYLDTRGHFTTIDAPGSRLTIPYGINDLGQIVGSDDFGAYLDTRGHFTTINVPAPS